MSQAKRARLGYVGYAQLLARFRCPATREDISKATGISEPAVRRFVKAGQKFKRLYVCAWRVKYDCAPHPVLRIGNKPDAPRPDRRLSGRKRRIKAEIQAPTPPELVAFFTALDCLESPLSARELSDESGIALTSAWELIGALRKLGLARVSGFERSAGGPPIPLYQMGGGADAVYEPKSTQQINRESWLRRTQRGRVLELTNAVVGPLSAATT